MATVHAVKIFIATAALAVLAEGCYFLQERKFPLKEAASSDAVLGLPLGEKAGGPDENGLQELYLLKTAIPPAALRPDPDLYARQRLREYRAEGKTIAKLIGDIEPYRPLLGGASEDFRTVPAETYDATSLLAVGKVAENICRALVDPNASEHPGWGTILPYDPTDFRGNLRVLAQKITGMPAAEVSDATLDALQDLMDADGLKGTAAYVTPCVALLIDANSLLF